MLYLVATPIGNLGDFSDRARRVLSEVDLIACEDTRTSKSLFTLLSLPPKKLIAYHEHNASLAKENVLTYLREGKDVALVCDAGTPLISDPGYKLVRACREENIPVTAVPGANAALTALQLSGLPSDSFFFQGFLPSKKTARRKRLSEIRDVDGTLIIYESPHRLEETLDDIADILGMRQTAVVREITKKFEEVRLGSPRELLEKYRQDGFPKGEIVLVIDRARREEKTLTEEELTRLIQETAATRSTRDAADIVARQTGLSKKEAYARILKVIR